MLPETMAVSNAEMSIIHDEKKVQEPEDEKVLEAEKLANEALRLATESRRAAEKLAEIRATIAFLQQKANPKPQLTVTVEEKSEEVEKREESPREVIASPAAPVASVASVAPVAPVAAVAPVAPVVASPVSVAPSIASPVSILKKAESKIEGKEFRFAPDVIDHDDGIKAEEKSAPAISSVASEDEPLIIRFCDALGMDRLCALEIDHDELPKLTPEEKVAYIKNAFRMESENGPFIALSRSADRLTVDAAPPAVEEKAPAVQENAPVVEESPEPTTTSTTEGPEVAVESATPAEEVKSVAAPVEAPVEEVKEAKKEPTMETPKKETPKKEIPQKETIAVAVAHQTKEVVLTPAKKHILAKKIAPSVVQKADPFAGELDDMDFDVGCGGFTL